MIGEWPNCHARVVEHSCGLHQTGRYPDCHWVECPDTYFSKTGNFVVFFLAYLSGNCKELFIYRETIILRV